MKINVTLDVNDRTLKFLESEGYNIYACKESSMKEKEALVRRIGKDLNIIFGDQLEAEDWRNQFALMLEQDGYHLSREKPENIQSEAIAAS